MWEAWPGPAFPLSCPVTSPEAAPGSLPFSLPWLPVVSLSILIIHLLKLLFV